MLTTSNGLSFIRAPLAHLFLEESPTLRILAIVLAMITDSIDGYLARKSQSVSRFGAILDPTMDKFFVYFAISILYFEDRIVLWEVATMISRDFFLCIYGVLMMALGRWRNIVFRAIRWGKITTALQFIVLLGLVIDISFPWYVFVAFVIMGWLAFLELFQVRPSTA